MKVIMLLIAVGIGDGTWVELPQQQQTIGWTDCEDRARQINEAALSLLLAYCREVEQ